ncbi:hypothetical protein ACQZV8_05675 [Magnetococcales bacterium HHB-1]
MDISFELILVGLAILLGPVISIMLCEGWFYMSAKQRHKSPIVHNQNTIFCEEKEGP